MKRCLLIAVLVFELSCHGYTGAKVVSRDYRLEYAPAQGSVVMELDERFFSDLSKGFCIFGPIDEEMRAKQMVEFLKEYYPHLTPNLDELHGVPKAAPKINYDYPHRDSTFEIQRSAHTASTADR